MGWITGINNQSARESWNLAIDLGLKDVELEAGGQIEKLNFVHLNSRRSCRDACCARCAIWDLTWEAYPSFCLFPALQKDSCLFFVEFLYHQ